MTAKVAQLAEITIDTVEPTYQDVRTREGVPPVEGQFCSECGKYSVAGARFCSGCGAALGPVAARHRAQPKVLYVLGGALGVLLLAIFIGSAQHLHPAPPAAAAVSSSPLASSSGNVAQDKLLALSLSGRARALGQVVGDGCVGTKAFYRGSSPADHSAFWSVRCASGKSYEVQIKADATGSTTVADCDVLRALAQENCFAKIPGSAN